MAAQVTFIQRFGSFADLNVRLLTRWGVLVEDVGQTHLADPNDADDARTLRPQQAATPWRADFTHLVMCPREFMQWLAALVEWWSERIYRWAAGPGAF